MVYYPQTLLSGRAHVAQRPSLHPHDLHGERNLEKSLGSTNVPIIKMSFIIFSSIIIITVISCGYMLYILCDTVILQSQGYALPCAVLGPFPFLFSASVLPESQNIPEPGFKPPRMLSRLCNWKIINIQIICKYYY